MASLTPGVLSKLLKHADDKNYKVIGEYRTPLLQVIEIVPALSKDDPWRTKGFYLKLSDSEHAAYASIVDEDVDLIRGDKIKLGQFVYVSRLECGKPVPVIRGIKPVPKPRSLVGRPKDLIGSELLLQSSLRWRKKGLGEGSPSPGRLVDRRESLGIGKRLVVDGDLKVNGRRMSLDSARKGWDTPRSANAARSSVSRLKSVDSSVTPVARRLVSVAAVSTEKKRAIPRSPPVGNTVIGSDKKPSRRVISLITNKSSGISPPQSKEKKLVNDPKATVHASNPGRVVKVSLGSLSDRTIAWDSLPMNIQELGKGVVSHRDGAVLTASRALEEASAMEGIVRCMSMFADLCESSEKCSAGTVVETFLELHLSMERTASSVDMLLGSNASSISAVSDQLSSESSNKFPTKNAKAWIQAGVETDLSKFSLYSKQDKGTLNDKDKKSYRVVLEKPTQGPLEIRSLPNAKVTDNVVSKSNGTVHPSKKQLSAPRKVRNDEPQRSSLNGTKDAASLANKLIFFSRQWFLKYLETSLKKGFGIHKKDQSIQILFGNLKRVNQWLEEQVGSKHETDERIEAVRKKLYNFLLENVDSSACVPANK